MKKIQLTNGRFTEVDEDDYEILNKYSWYEINKKYVTSSMKVNGVWVKIYMHRFLMNPSKGLTVDHKDGNGFNNQRNNLRICTYSENLKNRRSKKNGTSKYIGVSYHAIGNKWQCGIRLNGKQNHIGLFKTEENAAIAYNIFAEKYHGEFARYNTSTT